MHRFRRRWYQRCLSAGLLAGVLYPLNVMLLSPALAAGAMALSSVFVVANALRLRRFGRANADA